VPGLLLRKWHPSSPHNAGSTGVCPIQVESSPAVDVSSIVVEARGSSLSTTEILAATSSGLFVPSTGEARGRPRPEPGGRPAREHVILNTLTSSITIYARVGGRIEESTNNGSSWTTLTSTPLISGGSFFNAGLAIHPGHGIDHDALRIIGEHQRVLGMFKVHQWRHVVDLAHGAVLHR